MAERALRLVSSPPFEYPPRNKETVRPFRLWDAQLKHDLPHRYYKDKKRAHMGALIESRWSEVGRTIEVYDVRYGKLLGQYTRRVDTIAFLEA